MNEPDRYLPIDEEGYVWFDGQRLEDPKFGAELIGNLKPADGGRVVTSLHGQRAWVESFDAPLMARHVTKINDTTGRMDLAYGLTADFTFDRLTVDQWDRFHGFTTTNLPFVLSRTAQFEFFDLLDGFDDDSIVVSGKRLDVPPWLPSSTEVARPEFWSGNYRRETTGWDLNQESPALAHVLPQLKLVKARILVLGSGLGHDAAYLARLGHVVTGVDFSPEAVDRAKQMYGQIEGLDFVQGDAFKLPDGYAGRFDLVFEHTCYCAVSPDKRDQLVRVWHKALHPRGHLLGVFYVNEKREGPPFGGSEWEVRERLKGKFSSVFWTRWHHSVEARRSRELVVYARKI